MLRRINLSNSPYKLSKNKQQLEASNQKIKIIDQLPNSISKRIRWLRLSHNNISKIDNIRQFVFLQEIDLSFNAIRDGQQILSLLQLSKLNKLFIDGNPFLLEPLDQNVMEFLVEKQTDIQILSGEALNNIKDLQQSELKVVFLQNYLKKMDYHDQIKAKRLGKTQALKKNPQKQQVTNKLIIDKIMPQFYTIIDDPKIKTKLKKQAIQLKKQQNLTFDEAMKKRKQQQQQKVNNLIKDILILVQQQQQQKQKNNFIENSSIKKQQANAKLNQKFMRIQHNFGIDQSEDFSNAFRRKLLRIKNNNKFNQQNKQSYRNSMNVGRHILDTDLINFDNTLSSKSKGFLPSPKQKQIRRSNLSTQNLKISSEQNFYSFNKTTPMPFIIKQVEQNFKNGNNKIKYETQHQTKYQTKKMQPKPQMKEPGFLQEYILNSTRRNQAKPEINPNNSNIQFESMGQQISPNANDMYDQYYTHLTKYNPSFALLYSQVSSLSHEQKSVLIQALAKDHKNKTIQLFMERLKVRNLKQTSIDNANIHQKKINQLDSQITDLRQNYDLSRKYAIQLQKQNSRLGQLIKVVTQDIMDVKEQNNNHKKVLKQKILTIQVLEYKLKQKVQEIQHFDCCEDIAEIIKENSKIRIKNQILKLINKRASQNTKIIKWKKKRQQKNNIKLLNISWSLLKKHLLIQVLAKIKNGQKNYNIKLLFFEGWKKQGKIGKEIVKKIQRIKYKIILKNNIKYLIKKKQQKVIKKKQNKLHNFWAHHHLVKKIFFKLKLNTKLSIKQNLTQYSKYSNFYNQLLKTKIFKNIKQFATQTKTIVNNMEIKHKNSKINNFYYKIRKLYIQNLVNKQKYNKTKSIFQILKFQLEDKRKLQAIKQLKNENQEIKMAINSIKKMFKQNNLKRLIQNIRIRRMYEKIYQKSQYLNKTLNWNRFIGSLKKHKNFIHKIQLFFIRTNKIANKRQTIVQRKTYFLQNKLKVKKIKVAFLNLFRNSYENKIYAIRVRQRIQQQQTQQLLQKMKSLQYMEIEAIKSQHQNYINILQQKDIRKQVQYRNQLMLIQNNRKQLEDTVWVLKKQVTELKQRQNLFFKQKQLIQDQIIMIQEGKASLNHLNQNLRAQLNNSNLKYQRMLELYTQAMIKIQKKDKLAQYPLPYQKQKQRDKTLQKQKRQIGVVKSNEIINQRNRIH